MNAKDLQLEYARMLHEGLIVPMLTWEQGNGMDGEVTIYRVKAINMD